MAEVEVASPTEPKTFWMSERKAREIGATPITPIDVSRFFPPIDQKVVESHDTTATTILRKIEKYGINYDRTGSWAGFKAFLPIVRGQVSRGEPIKLLLPGFPFKSPSKDKVLGVLPDLGEELALKHLNGLCENIKAIYKPGAEVHITSDGLVYNDCLGVSDENVWNFGERLREIAVEETLHHLRFIRLWDLLETPGTWSKDFYLANASKIRQELLDRFSDAEFEANMASKSVSDVQQTHAKYLEFLKQDLAFNEEYLAKSEEEKAIMIAETAKKMMGRWQAFAAALKATRTDYVRLSIHDGSGEDKLSMALIPQAERGDLGKTPWHSSIVVGLDGSFTTVQSHTINQDTHELVHHKGQPYFYRPKSDLFDWAADDLNVTFEHQYPTGLIVRSADNATMKKIPMQKVRALSNTFSPIVMRGFSNTTEEETFIASADKLGSVLVWPQYGVMAKVKDAGRDSTEANNVTSNEAMPMHFDGIFKYKDVTDPVTGEVTKVLNPPKYQYFTCLATAPKNSGYTLFMASRLFFRYLPREWSAERMAPVTWGTINTGFWAMTQEKLDLIVPHSVTQQPSLRWHEPWSKTKYSTCKVVIENEDESIIDVINEGIYDWRACFRFSWEKGDLLVNDNVAMLHTRSAYEANCDREMWRIHFD